ncbi:MAG: hypothetical protein NTV70_05460 [Acidobacteria bacterium]|nr:hypothetical protein [Acidobacteriota bacterium]
MLLELATTTVNCRVAPRLSEAVAGETVTLTAGGAVMVTVMGSLLTAPGAGCAARNTALPTIAAGIVVRMRMLVGETYVVGSGTSFSVITVVGKKLLPLMLKFTSPAGNVEGELLQTQGTSCVMVMVPLPTLAG